AALAALLGWRTEDDAWRCSPLDGALLALAGCFLLSGYLAMQTGSPRPAINGAWLWVSLLAGIVVLRRLVRTDRERRALVAVMVALAGALGTLGIEQFAVELPATRRAYFANPDGALRAQGIWYAPGSRERMLFEQRLQSTEPFATFALTNSLAGFLAPWLAVAAISTWQERRALPQRTAVWLGPLLSCVPIAACLLLTKSRSAWLAVMAGVALWMLWQLRQGSWWRGKWFAAAAGVVVAAFAIAAAIGAIDREVFTEAGKSLGYRGQYWQATAAMIADHPWIGVGPGQFQEYYTRYKAPTASEVVADPHNFLFEVAATAGLPALLLALLVAPLAWREARRAKTVDSSLGQSDSAAWILGGAIAGFFLAWPLGWLAQTGPSVTAFFVGLPAMLVALGLWHFWGNEGQLDNRVVGLGIFVLLFNLLAAGGIGIPGVAGSLGLLLTLWVGTPASTNSSSSSASRFTAAGLAGGFALLAVACYWTAYRPVTLAQAARQVAIDDPRHAESHLIDATHADSTAAQPWRDLASWRFARWQATPTPENWQGTAEAIGEGLKRSPNAAVGWYQAGNMHLAAHRALLGGKHLAEAIGAFQEAVELYPNHAEYRGTLAVALADSGEAAEARSAAERALELDRVTPHVDQKLSDGLREQLTKLLAGQSPP
ncbi:MAG: O-antigen ligase family protein, partial [Planctomycetia bacterium]|nr:O-antigen ligase family protein [Planctomycetia bacterium]